MAISLAVALLGPAWGQEAPEAPASPTLPAVQESARLAEQIAVLKAINPLNLRADQIQALLAVLKPGLDKLAQQEQTDARQLTAIVPQLRQAATLVATAQAGQATAAETEYRRLQQVGQAGRDRTRRQLRDELRVVLAKILAPEQQMAVSASGRAINLQQQIQAMASGNRGPLDGIARSLDQLRQTDPRQYADQRQQFAMRLAGAPNAERVMVRIDGDARGGGGPAGQAQREQEAARRAVVRQQMNDPAVQARLQPYLALADQVRRMPEASYQQQRLRLSLQVWQTREESRAQTNPQESVDYFINRALLSPVAVEVLEAKLPRAATG
jgi:hypothetical protein